MAAATDVYIGEKEDLNFFIDDDVSGFLFSVFNSDNSDYLFTNLTDLNLVIYDYEGGAVLVTIPKDGSPTGVSQATNDITLDYDYSAVMSSVLELGKFWYRLTWEDANNKPITVCYGDWNLGSKY